LIRQSIWPHALTDVYRQTDRQTHRQDRTGETDNGPIAQGEPFYKWSPNKCKCGISLSLL